MTRALAALALFAACAPSRAITRAGDDVSAAAQSLQRVADRIAPPTGAAPPTPAQANAAIVEDIARTVLDAIQAWRAHEAAIADMGAP